MFLNRSPYTFVMTLCPLAFKLSELKTTIAVNLFLHLLAFFLPEIGMGNRLVDTSLLFPRSLSVRYMMVRGGMQ